GLGSNNFIVMPDKSATGKSLVASDPHLALRAPAIFHMVALHIVGNEQKQLDVAGMAFAGIPGVVLGFNKNIAWGATVTEYDVTDLYRDKIVPDGKTGTVMVGGKPVSVVQVNEQFDYGDGKLESITIESVPGHGIIMPTVVDNRFVARDTTKPADVVTYRWTGLEPTGELEAFVALNQAKNVDEAKAAMEPFQVGSQNFVFGDTGGNIFYTTHSWVPVRPKSAFAWDPAKKTGVLPCLVLPGDGNFEWTGKVEDAALPQAKNPTEGYIATANSDQLGNSFDDDPTNDSVYLGCSWDPGFREARIHERLDALIGAGTKLGLDDLAKIQADAKSPLGTRIAPHFVAAIKRAEDARTGKTPAPDLDAVLKDPRYTPERVQLALSLLEKWGTEGNYDTPSATTVEGDAAPTPADISASQATAIFNASLVPLLGLVFDDEWKAMGNPSWGEWPIRALLRFVAKSGTLATADASGESIVWDDMATTEVESKDDRLIRALLAGLAYLDKTLGSDPDGWRWGKLHTVRFETLVSGTAGQLSIPAEGDAKFPTGGFPRHGDQYVVDASHYGLGGSSHNFDFTYDSGPAQRFVADMDPSGVKVRNVLPGGNVWIPGSPHFNDEAQMWRKNENAPIAFSPGEVVPVAEERIDLVP
ncbi:MAG: penicillin acylase family protein, partial [Polyangiales bacterium]